MASPANCRRIRVRGIVQGVGFRPFVWRLARELGLAGWVRNDAEGVEIEACGAADAIATLLVRLRDEAPPLARVDAVEAGLPTAGGAAAGFCIVASGSGGAATAIGADTAICDACLAEICTPGNRRHRYAFSTCTHCGPRYTIARGLPYDRARTSLAPFPLCPACAAEYADPGDRRFHAEANCCPVCGPRLSLLGAAGTPLPSADPLADALRRLQAGEILAIKGLGGFHLACDARAAASVARLRQRKEREAKPLAIMAAGTAALAPFAEVSAGDAEWLASRQRPIVLLKKRPGCDAALAGIAPGVAWLGAMLPCTPIQVLLFHEAAGRPSAAALAAAPPPLLLVMTSANPGGEPLAIANDEAVARLAGIADAFLVHDRDIIARADDSVLRAVAGGVQFLRRGRGFVPEAIALPTGGPSVLAFGGWYKNSICVTRGDEAFVSTHVGDLDNAASCAFLDETVARMLALTETRPALVAHDLHPDFHSSRRAAEFAAAHGLPRVAVQHHHAHIAAICAEHGVMAPVIGLALDGVGLGDDGAAWGGELLRVAGADCLRLGHLAPLPLAGGDRAAREPWRMAAAVLAGLGRGDEIARRFAAQPAAPTLALMLERRLNCPPTTSLGRVFDAAAGLLGVSTTMAYEGEAAMRLEALAAQHGPVPPLAGGWTIAAGVLDLGPLLAVLAALPAAEQGRGAALFHATLAAALAAWAAAAARAQGLATIACGGGCCLNDILMTGLRDTLVAAGFTVLEARRVSPGDGGLALGQAWVALNHAAAAAT